MHLLTCSWLFPDSRVNFLANDLLKNNFCLFVKISRLVWPWGSWELNLCGCATVNKCTHIFSFLIRHRYFSFNYQLILISTRWYILLLLKLQFGKSEKLTKLKVLTTITYLYRAEALKQERHLFIIAFISKTLDEVEYNALLHLISDWESHTEQLTCWTKCRSAYNTILHCLATSWIFLVPNDEYSSSTFFVTRQPLICVAFERRTCMLAPLSPSSWKGPSPAAAGCVSWWSSGTEPLWCQRGPDTFACRCTPCSIEAPSPQSPNRPQMQKCR